MANFQPRQTPNTQAVSEMSENFQEVPPGFDPGTSPMQISTLNYQVSSTGLKNVDVSFIVSQYVPPLPRGMFFWIVFLR